MFAKNCEKLSAMLIVRAEEKGQITSWLSTQLQIMCLVKTDADVKKSSFLLLGPKLYIELCLFTILSNNKFNTIIIIVPFLIIIIIPIMQVDQVGDDNNDDDDDDEDALID